jgi:hypothetical protein
MLSALSFVPSGPFRFLHRSVEVHFGIIIHYLGFEVLTAVVMGSAVLWDIKQCSPLEVK